jgi:hypothetical protein
MNFGSILKGLLLVSGSEKCQNSQIFGPEDLLGLDAESVLRQAPLRIQLQV